MRFLLLSLCLLASPAAMAQEAGAYPATSGGGGGVSATTADTTYLRLDASNDPLTGQLEIPYGTSADPALIFNHGGGFYGTASGGITMGYAKADGTVQFGTGGSLGNYFPVYMDIRGGIYDQGDGVVDFNDAILVNNTIASGNNLEITEGATNHFVVQHDGKVMIRHSDATTLLSIGSAGSQWFSVESSGAGNIVTSLPLANDSTPCGGDVCIEDSENLVPENDGSGDLGTATRQWNALYVDQIYDLDNVLTFGANIEFTSGEGLDSVGTFIPVGVDLELADAENLRCATDGGCNLGESTGGFDEVFTDNLVASTASYIVSQSPVQMYRHIATDANTTQPFDCTAAAAGVMFYGDDTNDSKPGGFCVCTGDNANPASVYTWTDLLASQITCYND